MFFSGSCSEGPWEQTSPDGGFALVGDMYREPDDVTRGATLCTGFTAAYDFVGDDSKWDAFEHEQKMFGSYSDDHCFALEKAQCPRRVVTRFEDGDVPPTVPTDPCWRVEKTSLVVSGSAVEVANQLIDFFGGVITASVTKVNRKKFKITVHAIWENLACELKVRIYRQASENTVEFQKRSGDGIAFNGIFRRASSYLSSETIPTMEILPSLQELLPFPDGLWQDEANSISPLLELGGSSEDERLQEETALGFAAMAKDDEVARRLCITPVFAVIYKFLQSDRFGIAYPTSCLLSSLAQHEEAGLSLADMGILDIALTKMWAGTAGRLVEEKIGQALTHCGKKLPHDLLEKLTFGIAEALDGRYPAYEVAAEISRDMHKALQASRKTPI